jgi:hypothetical protein
LPGPFPLRGIFAFVILWILEDNAERIAEFRRVGAAIGATVFFFRSAVEFIAAVDARETLPEVISLDHDLATASGIELGTGRQVADYLASCPPFAQVLVASTNQSGVAGMLTRLAEAGWAAERIVPYNGIEWITAWGEVVRSLLRHDTDIRFDAPTRLSLRIDGRTRSLLHCGRDLPLLGVIDHHRQIELFEASPRVDRIRQTFPGHRELLDSGIIQARVIAGFSVVLRHNQLLMLRRNSIANEGYADFCVPPAVADGIIRLLKLEHDESFRMFPTARVT